MTSDLANVIRQVRSAGKTREAIYLDLLTQGHTVDMINEAWRVQASQMSSEEQQKRTIHIILTVAALMVGVGVFSFVASNWQYLDRPVKLLIIIAGMIGAYAAGAFAKKRGNEKTGAALMLLGTLIYGAGIFLVAQMYHIRANWPDGFLLWMLGVIAMAFASEIPALLVLGFLLGVIAMIGHPTVLFYALFDHSPLVLTSSVLLAFSTAVTFCVGWTLRKRADLER